jgi:cell division protein FtsX
MRGEGWVRALPIVAVLALTACGRDTGQSVTTDTLSPAAQAALDCATSMGQATVANQVVVFMEPSATSEQIERVRATLTADPLATQLHFTSQADALAEFKALFGDSPDVTANVTAAVLPSSFRFVYNETIGAPDSSDLRSRLESAPGVKAVVSSQGRPPCSTTDPAMVRAAERFIENRFGPNSVIVFMDPSSGDDVAGMRSTLLSMPVVRGIVFVSQDDALAEFRCLFKDDAGMIASVTKEILPASFRIDVGTDESVIRSTVATLKLERRVKIVVPRPTPAELLAPGSLTTGPGGFLPNPDCPTQGQRLR